MAYCPKCGEYMHDKAELCLQCGYRVQHKTITNTNKKIIKKENEIDKKIDKKIEKKTIKKEKASIDNKNSSRKSEVQAVPSSSNTETKNVQTSETIVKKIVRFIFTFLWGFIGSFIINHSSLKPKDWKSRTCAYFFWGLLTLGIYSLAASICNFVFDENQENNMGYFKE